MPEYYDYYDDEDYDEEYDEEYGDYYDDEYGPQLSHDQHSMHRDMLRQQPRYIQHQQTQQPTNPYFQHQKQHLAFPAHPSYHQPQPQQ